MAIRVQWGEEGVFAICDTTTEAADFLRQMRPANGNGHSAKPSPEAPKPLGTDEKVQALVESINEKGKGVLQTILAYPGGIEGANLSTACGVDLKGIGGVLGSISKAIDKAGFSDGQVLKAETKMDENRRRFRWYVPGKILLEYGNRFK